VIEQFVGRSIDEVEAVSRRDAAGRHFADG
jgi:hypothetical protein